jgi:hypothetical protein
MHRIDSHNAVPEMPPLEAPEADPGFFSVGGDPGGADGTVVSAAWLNSIQEEIISVIVAAGFEPTKGQYDQLKNAIVAIITAHTSVTAAQERADSAYVLASQADTKGGSALSAASGAQETADEAEAKADAAQSTANQGLEIAQGASATAIRALEYYVTTDEAIDADEEYSEPKKTYITNTNYLNFPDALSGEIFFTVGLSDTLEVAYQACWSEGAQHIFSRTGAINDSDEENPIVTWTPWNSVAVPEVVKSVQTVVNPANQPAGTYLVITMETEGGDVPVYVNLSQIVGEVYSAGNNGITISADHQIGLKLSQTPGALTIAADGLAAKMATATTSLTFGATGTPGTSDKSAREDHTHTTPGIDGKQDKIPAGSLAGHALLDTTAAGSVAKSPGVLTLTKNLTVGAASTYTGAVTVRSAGSSPTTITGPNNGTATLQAGTAEITSNKTDSPNMDPASASSSKFPSEKGLATAFAAASASIAVKRGKLVLSAELASGSNIALGESYVVGSKGLLLFFDNVLLEPGPTEQYVEVGTAGASSQTVQINFTLPAGSLITYVIFV